MTVFAYEGAVALAFARQEKHANAVHGCDKDEEDHPLPREWIRAMFASAAKNGGSLDWINCGLCVDERGVTEANDGCRRGSPADLWQASEASDNTLITGGEARVTLVPARPAGGVRSGLALVGWGGDRGTAGAE